MPQCCEAWAAALLVLATHKLEPACAVQLTLLPICDGGMYVAVPWSAVSSGGRFSGLHLVSMYLECATMVHVWQFPCVEAMVSLSCFGASSISLGTATLERPEGGADCQPHRLPLETSIQITAEAHQQPHVQVLDGLLLCGCWCAAAM